MSKSSEIYPVFINCYNRLKSLLQIIAWLECAGQRRIYLVDNASTYPPLLAYYERTPYTVIRLGRNVGHRAVWKAGLLDQYAASEYYVVTDPDIVPDEHCPLDAVAHFRNILDRYPAVCKVGFGLRIDDLPDHYKHAATVRRWESQFWTPEMLLEPGIYYAPIDTSFALHRPYARYKISGIRTGVPYVARHTSWYVDTDHPDPEEIYYRQHARAGINHWDGIEIPKRLIRDINAQTDNDGYSSENRGGDNPFSWALVRLKRMNYRWRTAQGVKVAKRGVQVVQKETSSSQTS